MTIFDPDGRREIGLGQYNMIGRHSENQIQIKDGSVSKEHSMIFSNGNHRWIIRDMDSKNGSFVNGMRVQKEARLHDGDEIRLGNIKCIFRDKNSFTDTFFETSKQETEPIVLAIGEPIAESRFLPEKEISDINELRSDYEKLRVTYELQRDIGLLTDIKTILDLILKHTFEFLECDRGVILLIDKDGELEPKAYKSLETKDKMTVSSTLIHHVQKEKTGILSSDISMDSRFEMADSIAIQGIRSSIAVPIIHQDDLLGIMIIDSSQEANAFTEKDLNLVTNIANQTAQMIKNSLLHEELKLLFDSSIRTLSAMVDARHSLTAGHSQRVTEYSLMIAREMCIDKQELDVLEFSALLHDIGKIGIGDHILLKEGAFTEEEEMTMKTHTEKTKVILNNFKFPASLHDVPDVAACHHEKVNGQGYPYGMTGDQMPALAKIIAVADVFDALTSVRDYPKYNSKETINCEPMPLEDVVSILKNESGSHFDPEVVSAFMRCLPRLLLHFRGNHFPPEYVDDMIQSLSSNTLH
ncbi:MAG: FHA domain-containing protein [Thermodesulfobacteriota bacterium]|nr:FHA domain-containing protein [Thermodesulfobacteriota bacterium]